MSDSERTVRLRLDLGPYEKPVQEALRTLDRKKFSEKIWKKDAALWKQDARTKEKIKNRLGWLTIAREMVKETETLTAFSRSIQKAGFKHVVLLGMGGSSLCPEVCRKTYGVATGFPELIVLDSTHPATIIHVEESLDIAKTLFIAASKSGTTIEMQSLYGYFLQKVQDLKGDSAGQHFIAITDPGTPLEKLARELPFREVFINPPDIGGRYSALSYFGLVPAALIGLDLNEYLERALEMIRGSGPEVPAKDHPGLLLGAVLGALGKAGRDKVTLIASPELGHFGVWAEQLIAESTGKEGKGLVPIQGENLSAPLLYAEDRLFVYLTLDSSKEKTIEQKLKELILAGHPVVRIQLRDTLDLAGEFFRWEIATAAAGFILGINPFDEPNVSESKKNTSKALKAYERDGSLNLPAVMLEKNGIGLTGSAHAGETASLKEALEGFLDQARKRDYVAILAYLEPSGTIESLLQEVRHRIRHRLRLATTLGYGPRYLHSTGQLHKGGAGNGLFIQITEEDGEDITIPGEKYGFGTLKRAQALGDFHSLVDKGLRVLEIRLGKETEKDLNTLLKWMEESD